MDQDLSFLKSKTLEIANSLKQLDLRFPFNNNWEIILEKFFVLLHQLESIGHSIGSNYIFLPSSSNFDIARRLSVSLLPSIQKEIDSYSSSSENLKQIDSMNRILLELCDDIAILIEEKSFKAIEPILVHPHPFNSSKENTDLIQALCFGHDCKNVSLQSK